MIKGLYTSGYGMLTLQKKMDVVANNMANVATTGFKKDSLTFEAFSEVMAKRMFDNTDSPASPNIGNMTLFNNLNQVYTDYEQGTIEQTGNTTDMSLLEDKSAFFSVAVPDGKGGNNEYYTRDGGFQLMSDGTLCTRDGYPVVSESGAIKLAGKDFIVRKDGTISQNGQDVAKLKIRSVQNPETLRKFGSNLVTVTTETTDKPFAGVVAQSALEQSNVNSVREMVDMISVMRAYDANQKLIQYQDATLDKACNEIGRLR